MANHKAPEEIRAHMRRVELEIPALSCGEVIREVYLRRPTARYLEEAGQLAGDGTSEAQVKLATVSLATGLTPEDVKELDINDFAKIMDEIADFFASAVSGPPTPSNGEASSQTAPQS